MQPLKNLFCRNKYFMAAKLEETNKKIINPSRGWYEIYSFNIDEQPDFEELKWCLKENEPVVFVRIDISAVKDVEMSEKMTENVDNILDFFSRAGKDIIFRAAYDTEGMGLKNEPQDISLIYVHLRQLGGILRKYEQNILVVQGLLIGSWGEMHSSAFDSEDNIRMLYRQLRKSVGSDMFISVRKPQQIRYILSEDKYEELCTAAVSNTGVKTGLFNDGIFGSDTHLGTFADSSQGKSDNIENKKNTKNTKITKNTKWNDKWNSAEEFKFLDYICEFVPAGGEAVLGDKLFDETDTIEILKSMHITYLNCVHDKKILNSWKEQTYSGDGVFKGQNLYDYIGEHLGYRILVTDCLFKCGKKDDATVIIKFENTGFAALYDDVIFKLMLEETNNQRHTKTVCINGIAVQQKCSVKFQMPLLSGQLFLMLVRKKDGRTIRTANKSVSDDRLYLGSIVLP